MYRTRQSAIPPTSRAASSRPISAIRATENRLARKRGELRQRKVTEADLRGQLAETDRGIARVSSNLSELAGQVHGTAAILAVLVAIRSSR